MEDLSGKELAVKYSALVKEWKENIYDKGDEIDSASEIRWDDLCYGWLMGKGMPPGYMIFQTIGVNRPVLH